MNLIKKVAIFTAVCVGAISSMTNIMATEKVAVNSDGIQYGFKVTSEFYTTTPDAYHPAPIVRLYQENRSNGTYLCINVNEANSWVYVNNSSAGVSQENLYNYCYRVTQSGWYEVRVRGSQGGETCTGMTVTTSDRNTTLDLYKEYKNGDTYIVIKGRDDDGIRSVTVNNSTISFRDYSDEVYYRVYNSGTYTVRLTDRLGNTKTESIYVDVNRDTVSLSLSKRNYSNKYYLVIKADSNNSISRVTVNGDTISFPSSGGTREYEVTKSGTYRVVVRDKYDYSRSDSLYIDVDEKTGIKPVVKVTQNYKVNNQKGWYLLISATDDGSIASVTINGENVPFDAAKGRAEYRVPVDGTYNIVVTDNEGNIETASTFAAGNAEIDVENGSIEGSSVNTESTRVVFKLNNREWSKDGISQEKMDVAPKMLRGRIYLPIRYIAYALGIPSSQISWNEASGTVTIRSGSETIQVKLGSKNMYVNNELVVMEAAPVQSSGRVMIPISQIKAAFASQNISLNWNNNTKELVVTR